MLYLCFILSLATVLILASVFDSLWNRAVKAMRRKKARKAIMVRHYQRISLENNDALQKAA